MAASTETGSLILKCDSTDVTKGAEALDGLSGSARQAEQLVEQLTKAFSPVASAIDRLTAAVELGTKSFGDMATSLARTDRATQQVAASMEKTTKAAKDLGETEEQAMARIHAMTTASLERVEAQRSATAAQAEAAAASRAFREEQQGIILGLLGYGDAAKKATAAGNDQAAMNARGAALLAAEDRARVKVTTAVASTTGAIVKNTEAMAINGGVARELGVLTGEALRGNYTRMEGSLITLANRSGALQQIFTPMGLSIIGVTAAIAALGVAAYKTADEQAALQKAIILSGNAAGISAEQMKVMAQSYATYYTSASKVTDLQKALLATGAFNTQTFQAATQAAVSFGEATGQSQEQVIRTFDQLSKDPINTLEKINQLYGWITPAVMDHVKALEEQGQHAQAVAEAFRAINSAASDTAAAEQNAQTTIDKLIAKWKSGAAAIGGYYQKLVNGISPEEQFQRDKSTYEVHLRSSQRNSPLDRLFGQVYSTDQLNAERQQLVALAAQIQATRDSAALAGQMTNDNKEGTAANQYYDQHFANLTKIEKKQKELTDLTNTYERMWEHDDGSNKRLAGVQRVVDAMGKVSFFGGNFDRDLEAVNAKYATHATHKADPFASLTKLDQNAQLFDQGQGQTKPVNEQIAKIVAVMDAGAKLIAQGQDVAKVQALVSDAVAHLNSGYAKQAETLKAEATIAVQQYAAALDKQNEALQRSINSQIDKIGMGDKEFQQQQQINDIYIKSAEALTQLQLKRASVAAKGGDTSEMDQDIALLQANTAKQVAIVQDGYRRMDAARADWSNGLSRALGNYLDQAADVAGQSATLFTNAFNGMSDALANFATTGKLNFKGLVTSILSDLAKMELRIAMSKILQSVMGAFLGSSGGNGAMATSFDSNGTFFSPNAKGGVYDSPSLSSYSGQIVNRPTVFAFASGAGVMGEAGPEAIMPLTRGSDGKLGVKAQGSAGNITINQNFSIDSSGGQESQSTSSQQDAVRQFAGKMKDQAKQAIADEMRPGGLIWRMQHA